MTRPVAAAADEATRYLAAAVHLDDQLAEDLIVEFLAEPRRAIPPAPGVRAEVVLREAVAARLRRVIVSAAAIVLLGVLAALALPLAVAWLAAGLAWRVSAALVTFGAVRLLGDFGAPGRFPRWLHWILTFFLWGIVSGVLVTAALGTVELTGANSAPAVESEGLTAVAVLIQLTLLGILLTGELLRRNVVDRWYRFRNYIPGTPPRDSVVRACKPYADRLHRIAEQDERVAQYGPAELVVYRGHNPFVGAGLHLDKWSWSTTLELYPADPNAKATIPEFRPIELQDYITKDLMALKQTPTLTPGWRFGELHVSHWALLASAYLLHYPSAEPLLRQLESGANPQLKPEDWATLMDSSPEWLRYFRCYRVEAWERQLAVSTYLHVGCQQRTLVLEWQAFVLPPIDFAYRGADVHRVPVLPEIWRALCEFALLPTTVPTRLGVLWRWVRDQLEFGDGPWESPTRAAYAFGSEYSVREIGAGDEFTSFFEVTDTERYLQILRDRTFDAVRRFLAERGLSTVGFDSAVTQINGATYIYNSNVQAGNVGGVGNRGVMSSATMSSVNPGGTR
ncbi:hypothetical protein JK358_00245 [Nocardia sp. 2]|uniref:Uncharacterized protein n=1 Tax=Nocardia acididurans TaxID=2802282 RepID=A0ABS1M100_9NOCA|nr:hypothetical protein [Nocardia acididurans]MBL1072818.1 hypothetical protein [Nocardia acididurans]